MNNLCIPIPDYLEDKVAEVEVTIEGKKQKFNFRVESFKWATPETAAAADEHEETELKIRNLKNAIESYDPAWELIQIFKPRPESHHVQVLFREKVRNG